MCALLKRLDCMTMSIDSAKQVTCSNRTVFLHQQCDAVWCFPISILSVSWQEMEPWTSSCLNGLNGDSCQNHSTCWPASSALWRYQRFSTCLELDLEAWADQDVPFQQHPQLAGKHACRSAPLVKDLFRKYLPLPLVFVLAPQARRQPRFLACPQLSDRTGKRVSKVEWKMQSHSWMAEGGWNERSSWSQANPPRGNERRGDQ